MKKKVYQSPLTTLLIFIGILLLYNCQKEDVFTKTTETVVTESKKYNVQKLGSKELQEDTEIGIALQKIRNRLQSNVSNNSLTERNVVISDGLVIFDNEVVKITIGTTMTWTFKIETPTHEASEIENFMIKKHGDVFSYYLIKYQDDDGNPETPHIAYLEQINGNALDTSNLNLSSRDAFDWEFGDGGGGDDDCEGIVVGYQFQTCNQGGYHTAGTYCCQHVGAPHGCQTNSGFCGFTCNGTSEVEILDFSHCDAPVGDPVDGGNENPNDNQIGGGSGSGNGDGSDTMSTPVGLINNGDDPCNPAPEGDLNGNCALDYFEGCLMSINNTSVNLLTSENLAAIELYVNESGCGESTQDFINSAVDALTNEGNVDWEERIVSELIGKEKCLDDHLRTNGNTFVKDVLSNFHGDDSEYSIHISSKPNIFYNLNGTSVEVNGITRFNGSKTIEIEISTSKVENRIALDVARTILHEYIHADMYRKLYTSNPTPRDLSFRDTYNEYENGNFNASSQHESMASLYVLSIRDALKSYHKNVLVGDYNYLSNNGANPIPDTFYEALAWRGLKNHNVQAWIDLPQSEKDALSQTLSQYYHSTTKNCPN